MYNILVVDDDKEIVESIEIYLRNEGYKVFKAYDGLEALDILTNEEIHLILMDIMMPKLDGIKATIKIRQEKNIPIILVSAKGEDTDKILGLNIGADDYITKPFKLAVFMSRINALLRRSDNFIKADTELNSNGINVQLLKGKVYKNGEQLDLTTSEYKLLCLFIENPDIILSADHILTKLWDCNENYIDKNTITVYIRRLRTKIEDNPGDPQRIVTVRRMGYKWNTLDLGVL